MMWFAGEEGSYRAFAVGNVRASQCRNRPFRAVVLRPDWYWSALACLGWNQSSNGGPQYVLTEQRTWQPSGVRRWGDTQWHLRALTSQRGRSGADDPSHTHIFQTTSSLRQRWICRPAFWIARKTWQAEPGEPCLRKVDAGQARWGAVLALVCTVAGAGIASLLRLDARHRRGGEEEQEGDEREGQDGTPRGPCHAC